MAFTYPFTKVTLFCLGLYLATLGAVCGQTPTPPAALPAQPLTRDLSGGQTHTYSARLAAGEFFQARVEQKGVDVRLRLLDAGGRELARMDSPNGATGPETLTWVAETPGAYTLEVSSPDAQAAPGAYTITRAASRPATPSDRRRVTAEKAFAEGIQIGNQAGQTDIAIAQLTEALNGWEELKDEYLAGWTKEQLRWLKAPQEVKELVQSLDVATKLLRESGNYQSPQTKLTTAKAKATQSLAIYRKVYRQLSEAKFGEEFERAGYSKSLYKFLSKNGEQLALRQLAELAGYTKEPSESVKYNKLSMDVLQEIIANPEFARFSQQYSLKETEALLLYSISTTLSSKVGNPTEALSYATQALVIAREIQKSDNPKIARAKILEAAILDNLTNIYTALLEREKELATLQESLALYRSLSNSEYDVAARTREIAFAYFQYLDYEKAIKFAEDALKLAEGLSDTEGQASILAMLAIINKNVGDEAKARELFNRRLAVLLSPDYVKSKREFFRKKARSFSNVATNNDYSPLENLATDSADFFRFLDIGFTYQQLKEFDKALEYYGKAEARAAQESDDLRLVFTHIGGLYENQENWSKALEYYRQALAISRRSNRKGNIASNLIDAGFAYFKTGKYRDALQVSDEALFLLLALGVGENKLTTNYASTLSTLGRIHSELGNRRLAIFYGKRAVNAIQLTRRQLRNLDPAAQRGYVQQNEKAYRRLAEWLIAAGRIGEAEQVLALLKEEELFEYLRRDDKVARDLLPNVNLDADERAAVQRYDELAEQITAIGKEYEELSEERKKPVYEVRPFPQEARLNELKGQLDAANVTFNKFLEDLKRRFGNDSRRVAQVDSGLQSILQSLKAKHTVFVSTIVGEKRLSLIVTTTQTQRAHTIDIDETTLNQLVADFRCALTNPQLDPRPTGQKLYDVLVKPIEKDLAGAGANTIVWSLDGTLRYLPPAALWDKERGYLAQRFASTVVTLASVQSLKDPISDKSQWRALGAGVSKGGEGLGKLPAVPEELDCVISDANSRAVTARCPQGVLTGRKLLDETFTREAFSRALQSGGYQVIHIASHFSFQPGNEKTSFLLLGGGDPRKFSVADLRNDSLTGAELVTFSACNTATPGGSLSNGVEVESFGAVAQKKGAKAVAATLWAVADPSTRDFMVKFYQLYGTGAMSKAEALRQAQLALAQESDLANAKGKPVARSEVINPSQETGCATLPKFTPDPARPYAHPYYWSPFILFGNWR